MKVALVITHGDAIGGAHIHVRDLAKALYCAGQEVKVFVGDTGRFTELLRIEGIPFHSLCHLRRNISPFEDFKAIVELKRALSEFEPDLVACHSSKAGWVGRIAAKAIGIPVVFTAHGWAFARGVPLVKRVIYGLAELIVAPLAKRIIAVSGSDRSLAMGWGLGRFCELVTIRNGVPDISKRVVPRQCSREVKLIMVARLDVQKNHGDLFRALSGLQCFDWSLDLIGDGILRQRLHDLACALGIDKRVKFLGLRNDVADLLAKAHVFVLTSNWEGLPLSILEAMRAGLPVVASDVGGVSEALVDQKTGFLVPRGDVALLRDRLEQLLGNPEMRRQMGRAGRLHYEQYFSFERMFQETLTVYGLALSEGGKF